MGTCRGIGLYFDSVLFWFIFYWFCKVMFGLVVLCSCSPQRGRCHPGRALGGVADQRKCPGPHFGFGSGKSVDKGGVQDYKVADTSDLAIMMWMRRYLAQVQLLDPDKVGEDTRAKLLDEVLPQGKDCDRLQAVECSIRNLRVNVYDVCLLFNESNFSNLEDLVVGESELNEFLLLDEAPVRQRYQLVVTQIHIPAKTCK